MEPCRGSDSGSNPDSGAPFLLSFKQQSFTAQGKKCKLECKLHPQSRANGLLDLRLLFTREDLDGYLILRAAGLTPKTVTWLKKSAELLWNLTRGVVSVTTMCRLRDHVLAKYQDNDAKRKVLQFARAFLRYMSKISFDQRYSAFDLFLQLPRAVKEQKRVTERIVTKDDIERLLSAIERSYQNGEVDTYHHLNYAALVLFGAYTGQRPYATIKKLTAEQFRAAIAQDSEKPVVHVRAEQDKIRMEHYVPLHPKVVEAVQSCEASRAGLQFAFESFRRWTKETKIPLTRCAATFVPSDLRKFAEQHGDVIGWDPSNKAYVMTHGVSGVEWAHYKRPLPEHVYKRYMASWGSVDLLEGVETLLFSRKEDEESAE